MPTAVFRVDASLQIGTGHVMRCVVLANALAQAGWRSRFVMGSEPGHLANWVEQNGHAATMLPAGSETSDLAVLLQALQSEDRFDWLVVDHYGLDASWEAKARQIAPHMLAIDDLANRHHDSDLLLDQNAGRRPEDYAALVPPSTRCLLGPGHALMAPAFAEARPAALARRADTASALRVLISLGGVDQDNVTERVLDVLDELEQAPPAAIDVVLGPHAPHVASVRARAEAMRTPVNLHVATRSMAQLLHQADVAIGAGGVSALERCVLGLPTIVVAVANNQVPGSMALAQAGAVDYIGTPDHLRPALADAWHRLQVPATRQAMSRRASEVCDGEGVRRVAQCMSGAL